MIGPYRKLAFRNLLKYKSFTLINLLGLGASLAACIIIFTFYSVEISYDKRIPNADRTYRIISRIGDGQFWSRSFGCFKDALEGRPEIEDLTSFLYFTDNRIQLGESSITVSEAVVADEAFIDFFGLELIAGRKEDIGQPNKAFITPEMAEILFSGDNPLGQELFYSQYAGSTADSIGYFTVAGIVKPLPENTHFGFQMIVSQLGNFSEHITRLKVRKGFSTNVYVRLFSNTQAAALEASLMRVIVPYLENRPGPPVDAFSSKLQEVKDIHFTMDINREPRSTTRKSMLFILASVGLLVLVLLTLNFLSTSIVQAYQQKKQTGIMRAVGANKMQLFMLSLFKIAMFVGLGLLISWLIVAVMESYLGRLFGSAWSFRTLSLQIILGGMVTGIPLTLLVAWGMYKSGSGNPLVKSKVKVFGLMTIVQFAIVIVLMGFSVFIKRQIAFMENKDLGYNDENTFVVRIPSENPRGNLLVEEIRKESGVISASTAHHHPGDIFQSMEFSAGDKSYPFGFRMADSGIFETLDIRLINKFVAPGGRMEGWVINETFYKHLQQDFSQEDIALSNFSVDNDASDQRNDSETSFTIAGVMEDFHYSSLHSQIGNFAFVMRPPETLYNRWMLVHYSEGQSKDVLAAVNDLMEDQYPGRALEFFSLKDNLREKYGAAYKLSNVINAFALLSILVACFGLYGISMFITQGRIKEIGIRKAYGAESWQILTLLNLGFLKWVVIAFVVACPLTVLILKQWQVSFAYKTDMPWWLFGLIFIAVLGVALLAVTMQTRSAARSNPADIMRHE